MIKITVYFKSGNKISFKCKEATMPPLNLQEEQKYSVEKLKSFTTMRLDIPSIEAWTAKKVLW